MKLFRLRIVSALAAAALVTGCATMPTVSPVMLGGTEVIADAAVGFIAVGPERGQGPEAVVRGFLLAAQSAPTMPTTFAAARQYLTFDASHNWRPGAQVWILDETAALELLPSDDPDDVTVRATGSAVAKLSSEGIYTEFRDPERITKDFHLTYDGEDWRISELEDGIIMPAQVFTAAFRYTKLYHPSFDYRTWVPDVRWFPQQTWRTHAIQALVAGPPNFLIDVVQPSVPENAAVTLDEISETAHGYEVRLRGWMRDVDAFNRALFQAQLSMLLTDGSGTQTVDLSDSQGPIPVPGYSLPRLPRTSGPAVAIADDELYWISGRDMTPVFPRIDLSGLDITAIAAAPGGADGVVVRNEGNELWWIAPPASDAETSEQFGPAGPPSLLSPGAGLGAGNAVGSEDAVTEDEQTVDPSEHIPAGRVNIHTGSHLVAPSIDDEGLIWTGEVTGPIQVVDYLGTVYDVTANWLNSGPFAGEASDVGLNLIEHLTIAPGGRQVAIVTRGEDGTQFW